LSGKNVLVTNPSGTIVDLNPLTGATRFSLAGATSVLAVDTARIYAFCGSDLCAYSTTNGALLWRHSNLTASLAAEAGGVLDLDRGIVLNAQTGKRIANLWPVTRPAPWLSATAGSP
jgi:hypothetical protein